MYNQMTVRNLIDFVIQYSMCVLQDAVIEELFPGNGGFQELLCVSKNYVFIINYFRIENIQLILKIIINKMRNSLEN